MSEESVQDDAKSGVKFQEYNKIKYIGHKDHEHDVMFQDPDEMVYVEEKIDGANARFMIKFEEGKFRIVFGSHHNTIGDSSTPIGGNWTRWTEYVKKKIIDSGDTACAYTDVVFFGEAMLKHSIMYDYDKHAPFILYDIYSPTLDEFAPRVELCDAARFFGFEVAPLLWQGQLKDMPYTTEESVPKSHYYDGQAEGVVIKSISKPHRMKYVSTKFKEVNKKVFGMSPRDARGKGEDSDIIIATYFTNARIDKIINKLMVEQTMELDMTMVPHVIRACMSDVLDECGREILESKTSWSKIEVSKKLAMRVREIISQLMVNRMIGRKAE